MGMQVPNEKDNARHSDRTRYSRRTRYTARTRYTDRSRYTERTRYVGVTRFEDGTTAGNTGAGSMKNIPKTFIPMKGLEEPE
jgi:hypothetical protein